jgi:predicted PurR-regulated permease PerM
MKTDKILIQYSLYAAATGLLIYVGIATINNIGGILSFVARVLGEIVELVNPLLIALGIAYLLHPAVQGIEDYLTKHKVFRQASSRRTVGIVVTYTSAMAVFFALIFGIYIMVGGKLSNNTTIAAMIDYLMDYLQNRTLTVTMITEKLKSLHIPIPVNLNEKIAQIVSYVQEYFSVILGGTTNFIISIGSNIASFIIGVVISIYLIKDSEYFGSLWNKIFALIFGKSAVGNKVTEILWIVDDTFKNYIRGQLLEAAIVGILSAIVLQFIGIDYALMIGIIAGICNMIPYVGPFAGTVLAVMMALLSGQPITALWAIVGMLAVQQVDNNLLAPKIVGDSVGLHPVFIMLAIIIGGNVGGLIGMLIAVPVAASVKILLSKWYAAHMEKSST